MKLTRLLHVADLHGSEMCFRKVVKCVEMYKPDVITVCGDLTGKGIVPIVQQSDGSFKSSFYDKAYELRSNEEVTKLVDKIRMNGWYEWYCTPSEMEEFRASEEMQARVFKQLIPETMKRWVSFASEALRERKVRLFMLPGNDDDFVIDEPLNATGCENIVNPEGKVVMIDDEHEMISTGFTNITPWHAERDIPEDELTRKIEDMASKVKNMKSAIFNFHCPPYGTMLDAAPKVDEKLRPVMSGGGVVIAPAGSTAVRAAIEKYQPLLGLHGHIHESRGLEKIGRTLCINPGSEYGEGILHGCIVNLGKDDIRSYLFTCG
ncbi:MAG: metallophosphoesterase [Candidatus Bathyarchaeia archaeon]